MRSVIILSMLIFTAYPSDNCLDKHITDSYNSPCNNALQYVEIKNDLPKNFIEKKTHPTKKIYFDNRKDVLNVIKFPKYLRD